MITSDIILQILESVIIPVFLVTGVGYAIQRVTLIESSSLSSIVLHVFTPCLIFTLLLNDTFVADEWWKVSVVAVVSTLALVAVSWGVSKTLGLSRELTTAFVLSTSFVNSGNYGLPVSFFAFGEKGLGIAVIFFVVTILLMLTLGVLVASNDRGGFRQAVNSLLRLPLMYTILVALAIRLSGVNVPQPILQAVNLMSQAAIPTLLVLLGMDLARSTVNKSHSINWKLVSLSSMIKLLLPILFVSLITQAIGLGGVAGKVTLVQASMPTGVFMMLISMKYGGDSHFVTSAIVVSTLASVLTLTLLLSSLV